MRFLTAGTGTDTVPADFFGKGMDPVKKTNITDPQTRFASLDELMPMFREQLAMGHNVRFSPRGVSMMPMLREKIDSVVLSPLPEKLKKYDLPLYQRRNGQYVLHRIVEAGETYTCIGDNQFNREQGIEPVQMIAVVTSFYRGEREIKVTDMGYRIYCRIWHYSRPLRHFWRRGVNFLKRHLG